MAGTIVGEVAFIDNAFVPPQTPIQDEDGVGYFVDGDALFQLNRALAESALQLIAQVHSHPGKAYHSSTDDRFAIVTADGGLSLVVPDSGEAPPDLGRWAVYRLSGSKWSQVRVPVLNRLLRTR